MTYIYLAIQIIAAVYWINMVYQFFLCIISSDSTTLSSYRLTCWCCIGISIDLLIGLLLLKFLHFSLSIIIMQRLISLLELNLNDVNIENLGKFSVVLVSNIHLNYVYTKDLDFQTGKKQFNSRVHLVSSIRY